MNLLGNCWQIILAFVIFCPFFAQVVHTLEDYELDLYDLVEEVNGTFYDFMGLSQDCSSSEVRRSYRKLSLVLHPDKNKNEDAAFKFRQLAGIYEVLKSAEKRERYNDILVNGLPTWRQPLYYYRKVRKFGFTESAVVLFIIISVIHYAMLWAAFWERKFEIEEVYQGRLKKGTKRKNHQEYNDELEEVMKRQIDSLVKPNLSHLLVCRVIMLCVRFILNLPAHVKYIAVLIQERTNPPPADEQPQGEEETRESKRKVRCDNVFSNMAAPEMADCSEPVVYQEPVDSSSQVEQDTKNVQNTTKKAHWTDADYSKLARAMQKFPAGSALRWEKIAQQLNHTPQEIISQAKQLKSRQFTASSEATTVMPAELKKKAADCAPQGGISYREEAATTDSVADWSQLQQKALESALASIPKTVSDRWSGIAELVPGKDKAECIARYKHLASLVKQRKLTAGNS